MIRDFPSELFKFYNTANLPVLIKRIVLFISVLMLTASTSVTTSSETANHFPPADADVLPWSPDRKLTWADFRGAPRARGFTGAATHARIKATPSVNSLSGRVQVQVRALFECRQSWAIEKAKKSDYLLNHEQRHFDIAEIYARKLRRTLQQRRITAGNWARVRREVIAPLFREYVRYDEAYDQETIHGIDRHAQAVWDRQIDRQLGDLAGYYD